MPDSDVFQDQAKKEVLYEQSNSDEVAAMLDYTPTNKYLTVKMARLTAVMCELSSAWQGSYRCMLVNFATTVEMQQLHIDGYARKQAIEIKGEGVRAENAKGGIMGLFGGGKKEK
jgi:hypothetical protein